jgi:hypothetical protein
MDGLRFPVTIHLHGTLAANAQGSFPLPIGMTLESVALVNSATDSDATLTVGTSADADGILKAGAIGAAGVPVTFAKANFDGALCDAKNPPHFDKGTVITWLVDFDGAGGTAASDVTLLFSFLEG